jgi:tRNA(Arg) A34 adenosine deaminase TadA
MTDKDFLKLAIEESKKAQLPHQYGAIIVVDGEVIAIDHNHVWERKDPSAHAEVSAIVGACQKIGNHNLKNATMYGSHEPCLMCFSCAAWAGVERIVYATKASEIEGVDDSYEFKGVSLQDLAAKLIRPISVEHIPLATETYEE